MERFGRLLRPASHPQAQPKQLTAQQLPEPDDVLSIPLFYLSPYDPFTIGNACEGVQIFGSTGSGKTSGSGAVLARSMLATGFGGLVLCAKPDEADLWTNEDPEKGYLARSGRLDDAIVIKPGSKGASPEWVFNFLSYELKRDDLGGGLTENIVNLLVTVVELAENRQGQGASDPFWDRAMKELLRNAIDLISLGGGDLTLKNINRLIASAPHSTEQADEDEKWQTSSYCAEILNKAYALIERPRRDRKANGGDTSNSREENDYDVCTDYWLKAFPCLDGRTRSSIVATFTGVSDMLSHGVAWELLCDKTNIVPEVTYKQGKIIILDLSIQNYREVGRVVQGIWKYMFQQAILRRNVKHYPRPVFLWADEAQNFISSFDYQYQSTTRSARACTVYLTQNISNYYSVLKGEGVHQSNSFLGNLQTKIFHAQSDNATNKYSADLIGQEYKTLGNYSTNTNEQGGSRSAGSSESVQYTVLPSAFTTLRKGGRANNFMVDGVVFQGGRIWRASGKTYLQITFNQKG